MGRNSHLCHTFLPWRHPGPERRSVLLFMLRFHSILQTPPSLLEQMRINVAVKVD